MNRGRYRAMLMQLLQCHKSVSREAEVKPWRSVNVCKGNVQKYEWLRCTERGHAPGHNQSSNTGTHPTGFRVVKAKARARAKAKASISRRKEHQTRRTRNAPSAKETIVSSPSHGQLRRKQ